MQIDDGGDLYLVGFVGTLGLLAHKLNDALLPVDVAPLQVDYVFDVAPVGIVREKPKVTSKLFARSRFYREGFDRLYFCFYERPLFVLCRRDLVLAMGLSAKWVVLFGEEPVGDSEVDNRPQGSQVNADGVLRLALISHVGFVTFQEFRSEVVPCQVL